MKFNELLMVETVHFSSKKTHVFQPFFANNYLSFHFIEKVIRNKNLANTKTKRFLFVFGHPLQQKRASAQDRFWSTEKRVSRAYFQIFIKIGADLQNSPVLPFLTAVYWTNCLKIQTNARLQPMEIRTVLLIYQICIYL